MDHPTHFPYIANASCIFRSLSAHMYIEVGVCAYRYLEGTALVPMHLTCSRAAIPGVLLAPSWRNRTAMPYLDVTRPEVDASSRLARCSSVSDVVVPHASGAARRPKICTSGRGRVSVW